MNKINKLFSENKERKLLSLYFCAGCPTLDGTGTVIKAMELINYDVHKQENFDHKLWDDLFIIAGYELDIDAPYPVPTPEQALARPEVPSVERKPIRASQYGRNIESMIDLVAGMEDGDVKTAVIRSLAIYMRTQYLIWNKDSVADETIFQDIEKLSDYRIHVPEGIQLGRVGADSNYLRPGQAPKRPNNNQRKNNNTKKKYR